MANIKIKGKDYKIKFDYLSIRKFSKTIGLKRPSEIEGVFNNMNMEDISFEDIDNITHLVRCSIKSLKVPSFDDITTMLMEEPDGITKVFAEFNNANSIDVTEEEKTDEEKSEEAKN
jgi:hypothetical protein